MLTEWAAHTHEEKTFALLNSRGGGGGVEQIFFPAVC
jgi:hypothetical protein